MGDVVSLQGSLEKVDGKLALRIPLEAGGDQFTECSRGIAEVKEGHLTITIPDWLAGMLRIEEGDRVTVNNADGKLNLEPVDPRPVQ